MVKSGALAKLPKEQKCHMLIGPVGSWFVHATSDIWTPPKKPSQSVIDDVDSDDDALFMDCDSPSTGGTPPDEDHSLSFMIYGSIGCFCYGEVYHRNRTPSNTPIDHGSENMVGSTINQLIDIKEDNSRVLSARFLKDSPRPIAMVLTENGTLVFHDCTKSETLFHFKKSELLERILDDSERHDINMFDGNQSNKRTKFDVTQQINSSLWSSPSEIFLGLSLIKEKKNLLVLIKTRDIRQYANLLISNPSMAKDSFIVSCDRFNLDLPPFPSPICCMEIGALKNGKSVMIAIAHDDGLITVVGYESGVGQTNRIIKLRHHDDQVSSMSFFAGDQSRFRLGLLASVSRNGHVLIWNLDNEYYFADYLINSDPKIRTPKINWFSLSFVHLSDVKQLFLAVSNSDNGLSLIEIPENPNRMKIRLKEKKPKMQTKKSAQIALRHHKLIFNVIFEPETRTLLTSSLDGNHILWKVRKFDATQPHKNQSNKNPSVDLTLQTEYMYPSLPNNSKTHMLRHNPIKEDLLGVALGRAGLRLFNISENPLDNRFEMSRGSQLVQRRLVADNLSPSSLAWHPGHEYRLALGTIEGAVLRVDLGPQQSGGLIVRADPGKYSKSRRSELDNKTLNQRSAPSHNQETSCQSLDNDDPFGVEYKPLSRSTYEPPTSQVGQTNTDLKTKTHVSSFTSGSNQSCAPSSSTDGVYSLCWGPNPICSQDLSRLAIYAIGSTSHRLFVYFTHNATETVGSDRLSNYLDDFDDHSLPESQGEASQVAWKPGFELMALGTISGKIIIVSFLEDSHADRTRNLFKRLAVIQGPHLGSSFIQCLAWHPSADEEDEHYYMIAASSNESPVLVFSIRESLLVTDIKARLRIANKSASANIDSTASGTNVDLVDKVIINSSEVRHDVGDPSTWLVPLFKLDAHKKAISDIAWSPHDADVLATSSFDRISYVWSIGDPIVGPSSLELPQPARTLSKFQARDRLFTIEWSLVDRDLVYTSGHECTIWAWRPSENRFIKATAVAASAPN